MPSQRIAKILCMMTYKRYLSFPMLPVCHVLCPIFMSFISYHRSVIPRYWWIFWQVHSISQFKFRHSVVIGEPHLLPGPRSRVHMMYIDVLGTSRPYPDCSTILKFSVSCDSTSMKLCYWTSYWPEHHLDSRTSSIYVILTWNDGTQV